MENKRVRKITPRKNLAMRATETPRIRLKDRPQLEKVIPLQAPFIINVDPTDKCNLACRFCPTGDRPLMRDTPGRNFGTMDFNLFRKIIDDIGEFEEPLKVLRLYKDGEPLANPHFAEMVRYAKESGRCGVIDTTTNGLLLSAERSSEIVAAGLDRINISVYGMRDEQYLEFSRSRVKFENLVSNVRHLYEHRGNCIVHVKINGDVISKDDEKLFYDTFGDICDEISVEHIMSCWPTFDLGVHGVKPNMEKGIYGQPLKEVLTCPYIFYSFSINSDGTVSACFLDWQRKLILGDVKEESVKAIWEGTKLREHRLMMLRGDRKSHPVCGKCDQMVRGMPDDIDHHREELLSRFVQIGGSKN